MKKIYYISYRGGSHFGPYVMDFIKSIKLKDGDLYNPCNKELNIGFELNSGYFTAKEFKELKNEYDSHNKRVLTRKEFIEYWGGYA